MPQRASADSSVPRARPERCVATTTPPRTIASARANETASVALTPKSTLPSSRLTPSAATRSRARRRSRRAAGLVPRNPRTTDRRRRAERHADADFVRALLDGVRHQSVGAHRGERHAGHAEDEQHRRRQVEEDQRAARSARPAACAYRNRQIGVERRDLRARLVDEAGRRAPSRACAGSCSTGTTARTAGRSTGAVLR